MGNQWVGLSRWCICFTNYLWDILLVGLLIHFTLVWLLDKLFLFDGRTIMHQYFIILISNRTILNLNLILFDRNRFSINPKLFGTFHWLVVITYFWLRLLHYYGWVLGLQFVAHCWAEWVRDCEILFLYGLYWIRGVWGWYFAYLAVHSCLMFILILCSRRIL